MTKTLPGRTGVAGGPSLLKRMTGIFSAALLAAGLMAIPAVPASASSGISVTWTDSYGSDTFSYGCAVGARYTYYGENTDYVTNGCGYRLWLAEYTDGTGYVYCVNPGAVAYGFPSAYESVWVSSNGAACDAGTNVTVEWTNGEYTPYSCVQGFTGYEYPEAVLSITNTCNTRIWLDENDTGSVCLSPGEYFDNQALPPMAKFWISANQAPCSAG